MKVMIRRSPETGLSIYVPKKDLEEPIVEIRNTNRSGADGFVSPTARFSICRRWRPRRSSLITVNARKRGDEEA